MSRKDVALGNIDAKNIESGMKVLVVEVFAIAITLGIWKSSWWLGGGSLVLLIGLTSFKVTAIPLAILFSFCWGFAGWWIGHNLIHNTGASIVIGIIVLMAAGGAHMAALEYTTSRNK